MERWQQIVVGLTAVASVFWMSRAIIGLFSRRAPTIGTLREGTAFESALADASAAEDTEAFDGWAYRVGARFAGRVRIVICDGRVAIAGPRVPRRLYQVWIWFQGLMLASVAPCVVAAGVALDWRWLAAAVGLFVASWAIGMLGAGLWPGLGELHSVETGRFNALEFPLISVSRVAIGAGWSEGGLETVLFPFKKQIDAMAVGRAVSFFAPDEYRREVRFAIHMYSDDDARRLADMLSASERM